MWVGPSMLSCPRRVVLNTLGAAIVVTVCFFYAKVQDSNFKLKPKELALGTPSDSCSDGADVGSNRDSSRSGDAAVDKSSRDGEQLVALKPGQLIGPYRLQEHLGYLGSRPIHEYDPAFHPHEAKRVGFHPRGLLSPPPLAPVCPSAHPGATPWPTDREGAVKEDGGGEALVLKAGGEENAGEGSYRLKGRFEGGSHGEVWRGLRLGPDGEPSSAEGFVLKRMLLEKGQHVLQAGIREIYFGELLQSLKGSPRIARYVEHFYLFGDHERGRFRRAGDETSGWKAGGEAVPTEMWLVFRDEGVSLRHYLYTEREADGFVLHGQSNFWRDMRLDPKGPEVMKSILRQTLEGTRFLHEAGVLHRDLKPSNLIVSVPSSSSPFPPPPPPPSAPPTRHASPAGGGGSSSGGSGSRPGEQIGDGRPSSPGDAYQSTPGDVYQSPPAATMTTPVRGWGVGSSSRSSGSGGDTTKKSGKRRGGRGGGNSNASDRGGGRHEPIDFSSQREGPSASSSSSSFPTSSARSMPLLLRVADFSSAVDEGAMAAGLYGTAGPAQGEETLQYAPPEVLFDPKTAYSARRPESYDMWSIGVILLELILGTPEVFTVDQRTRAILDRDLAFEDDAVKAKAYLLAAMADMCIYSGSGSHGGEGSSSPLGDRAVVDERCTLAELGKAVHTRDALDIGFPDQWGLDLLWRLLRWDPMERISGSDALEHAYFVGPYRSRRDGSLHATQREAMEHDGWFTGSKRVGPDALCTRPPRSPYAALWGAAAPPSSGADGFNDDGREGGDDAGKLVQSWGSPWGAASEAKGSFTLDHQHTLDLQYTCPKCNRSFELWKSCHNHVVGRGHSTFCQYDSSSLPPCISSHSMLPFDPHSGWCDVQGRRSRIEDYHSIVFQEDYKFYGVFDGHCGTRAAKFASRALHLNLEVFLNAQETTQPPPSPPSQNPPGNGGGGHTPSPDSHAAIERAVRAAFRKTQKDFLGLVQPGGSGGTSHASATPRSPSSHGASYPDPGPDGAESAATEGPAAGAAVSEEDSGTTATVALVYPDVAVVAHVGDSRAVFCCDDAGRAVEITEDHTPYSPSERARVEANGGSVEHRGVLRVNGELAVTRTLGNRRLSRDGVLSSEPDVVFVSHRNGGGGGGSSAAFLVLASDGLWDVVSSQEAVDMVKEVILGAAFQVPQGERGGALMSSVSRGGRGQGEKPARGAGAVPRSYGSYAPEQTFQVAATALTHEAYVRGSTDNIGVCVVDLRHTVS